MKQILALILIFFLCFLNVTFSQHSFVDQLAMPATAGIGAIDHGDIDGDGDIDFLVMSGLDDFCDQDPDGLPLGQLMWFETDSSMQLIPHLISRNKYMWKSKIIQSNASYWENIKIVDLDQDGHMDIVAGVNSESYSSSCTSSYNIISENIIWFKNDGNNQFNKITIDPEYGDDNERNNVLEIDVNDFDNDGDLDIVHCSYNYIYIYINDSSQNFTKQLVHSSTAANTKFRGIDVVDYNQDSFLDIAYIRDGFSSLINAPPNNDLGICYNQGNMSFNNNVKYTYHEVLKGIIKAADMNGDNIYDLVTAGAAYQQQQDYMFCYTSMKDYIPFIINTNTQLIDIVDLNKDGLNDLITLSDDNEHIVWNRNYINWADTTHYFFTDTIISIDKLEGIRSVKVLDYNKDSIWDIVCFGHHGVYYYEGTGNQSNFIANYDKHMIFGDTIYDDINIEKNQVFFDDIDNDNLNDLIYINEGNLVWHKNLGQEVFQYQDTLCSTTDNGHGYSWSQLDIDNDGDLDYLSKSQYGYSVIIFENIGNALFQKINTGLLGMLLFDLDSDGDLDLLSKYVWHRNDGGLTFNTISYGVDTDMSGLNISSVEEVVDIDNDGDWDIFVMDSHDEYHWYENEGGLNFTGHKMIFYSNVILDGEILGFIDYDKDGDKDLIFKDDDSNTSLQICINDGNTFEIRNILNISSLTVDYNNPISYQTIDWNKDGWDELYADGHILDFDSTGNLTEKKLTTVKAYYDTDWSKVYDLDMDGDYDILQEDSIYYNDGNDNFTSVTQSAYKLLNHGGYQKVIDFDGDNDLDILAVSTTLEPRFISLLKNMISSSEINYIICEGDSQSIQGQYFMSDTFIHTTLTNYYGYDSIISEHLRVLPRKTLNNLKICPGDSFEYAGNYYFIDTLIIDSLTNSLSCDSIVNINLTLYNPDSIHSYSDTICQGDSLDIGGVYFYSSGIYMDTLINVSGCDSILEMVLNIENDSNTLITTIGNSVYCDNDSINLSLQAPSGFASYYWNTGESNQYIQASGDPSLVLKDTILSEDFETGQASGWTQTSNASDGGFLIGTNLGSAYFPISSHTSYLITNDDACDCNKNSEWFMSSSFDIPANGITKLKFSAVFKSLNNSSINDYAKVYISEIPNVWSSVFDIPDGDTTWTDYEIDFSTLFNGSFVGKNDLKLAFVYADGGAWAYGLALDDILLANYDTAYSSKDYYVSLQSSRGCFYSSDTVSLIIGDQPSTSSINGATISTVGSNESYSVSLNNGSSYDWIIDNGTLVSSNLNNVLVNWTNVGTGTVSVVETDSSGCIGDTVSLDVQVDVAVGISDNNNLFNIYPNPNKGTFLINFGNIAPSTRVIITELTGKLIYDQQNINQSQLNLDLELSSGVYFVIVKSDNRTQTKKLLVE